MAVAWFIVPYKRHGVIERSRYPAIDDYTAQITAAGGAWAETEILGDRCIVKVRAPAGALDQLASLPGYRRLPLNRLDDPLSTLPDGVRQALRDELLDQGYTLDEIRARFPGLDLSAATLGDVLRFMATRRRKPRWDEGTESIVLDGEAQACRPVDEVDRVVS